MPFKAGVFGEVEWTQLTAEHYRTICSYTMGHVWSQWELTRSGSFGV